MFKAQRLFNMVGPYLTHDVPIVYIFETSGQPAPPNGSRGCVRGLTRQDLAAETFSDKYTVYRGLTDTIGFWDFLGQGKGFMRHLLAGPFQSNSWVAWPFLFKGRVGSVQRTFLVFFVRTC